MVDDVVNVQLVQERVAVLVRKSARGALHTGLKWRRTLETEAVKTTTSYNSPTRFMNWSTPGRLITYTLW